VPETARYSAGDHSIVLGEAAAVGLPAGEQAPQPLGYFREEYARLSPPKSP
jgi:hypothetical protein